MERLSRCIPCLNTKSLLEDVTTDMKAMLSSHGHHQPQPMQLSGTSPDTTMAVINEMAEASKRLRKKRKKKQQQQQMKMEDSGHLDGEGGGLEEVEVGGEPEEEEEYWVAEVDLGVLITFVSLPDGGNGISKIRFRKDIFDASEAQKWWNDNYENIVNLYSIQRTNASPLQSDDESRSGATMLLDSQPYDFASQSPSISAQESSHMQIAENSDYYSAGSSSSGPAQTGQTSTGGGRQERRVVIPGKLVQWVVEDQPGVFVTIRSLSDGAKELRRVELSRERFGEVKARVWWEENKDRLHKKYT